MKKEKRGKKKEGGLVKECFAELGLDLLFELIFYLIWNVILFIPRMIIRFVVNLFTP